MKSSKVYSFLQAKAERKGRTKQELDQIITWLTGYTEYELHTLINAEIPYGRLLEEAPCFNASAEQMKGIICGVRIEAIEKPLMWRIRILDKLVDELSKGKSLEKIIK